MENTEGNPSCEYEHGLSVYVETENHKLLVDTGASDKTWTNARQLGVNLEEIDTVILSHGHYDHSGGIMTFAEINKTAAIYMQKTALEDYYHGDRYIGIDKAIGALPQLRLLGAENEKGDLINAVDLDEEISIFAGIRGRRLWPASNRVLSKRVLSKGMGEEKEEQIQDEFDHEQCVVIREKNAEGEKTILISGCAHNGILNILDRYRSIYGDAPDMVISGFHMMKKAEYTEEEKKDILNTAEELAKLPTIFYSGHCTGQPAMDLMKPIMGDKLIQLHSGMTFGTRGRVQCPILGQRDRS